MKFMILMIPGVYRGNKKIDPNFVPPADAIEKMGKFNEEMLKAGIMLDGLGLHPLTKERTHQLCRWQTERETDGPFVEAKEVLGGYSDDSGESPKSEAIELDEKMSG